MCATLSKYVPTLMSIVKPMTVCKPTPRLNTNSVCPPVAKMPRKGNLDGVSKRLLAWPA